MSEIIVRLLMENKTDQKLLSQFLMDLGYIVKTSDTITSTEEWLMSSLVILDEVTARRIGRDVLKFKQTSAYSFVPTVVLISKQSNSLRWLNLGFDETIPLSSHKDELTARLAMLLRLREQSQIQYRLIFENINIGIYRLSHDNHIVFANKGFAKILGYQSAEEIINKTFKELGITPSPRSKNFSNKLESAEDIVPYESTWTRRDGYEIQVVENAIVFKGDAENNYYYASTIQDVSARVRFEQRVKYMAHHDPLTNLFNRSKLEQSLDLTLQKAARRQDHVAVIIIDLDRFKTVNDTFGHFIGDLVLCEIANRLKNATRKTDAVARVGGDEFVIVLADLDDSKDVIMTILNKIRIFLAEPFLIEKHSINMKASLGISIYPFNGQDVTTLLKHADIAMYTAKKNGGNNFKFCTKALTKRAQKKVLLEEQLHNALSNHEFYVHYQPKVDFQSGKITGVEALLRWNNPTLGSILPHDFIPLAEETGLIVPLTEMVFSEVCQQINRWKKEGQAPIDVAINLSGRSFIDLHFMDSIAAVLKKHAIDPHTITLEITESILIQEIESNANIIKKFTAIGVKISIDDFGTGYSSLNYLKYFAINSLKIDQSFVRDIVTDPNDALIVCAMITIAHSLKLKIIAEGVETKAQYDFLKQHDCDEMQGFYFCKPCSSDDLIKFIEQQRTYHAFPESGSGSGVSGNMGSGVSGTYGDS